MERENQETLVHVQQRHRSWSDSGVREAGRQPLDLWLRVVMGDPGKSSFSFGGRSQATKI